MIMEKGKEDLKIKAIGDNNPKTTTGKDSPKTPPRIKAKAKEEAKERVKENTEAKRAKEKEKVEEKDILFRDTRKTTKRKRQ
jgi:hypothetical protein